MRFLLKEVGTYFFVLIKKQKYSRFFFFFNKSNNSLKKEFKPLIVNEALPYFQWANPPLDGTKMYNRRRENCFLGEGHGQVPKLAMQIVTDKL